MTQIPLKISQKKLAPVIHIIIWLIFLLIPFFFLNQNEDLFFPKLIERWSRVVFFVLIFYINYLILTPKLLFKEKKWSYILSLILLITFFSVIWVILSDNVFNQIDKALLKENFPKGFHKLPNPRNFMLVNHIFTSSLVCGLATIIKISEKWYQDSQKQKEIEKELLSSKLEFLKHQISPHFFLNTLNNIYSLTEINVEDARKAIHKLSKMMRYLLYDSEKGETSINQEVEFINSYIELMKLRFSEDVLIVFNTDKTSTNVKIPPLLFISFIENAFKHGISYEKKSFINIYIEQTEENIIFKCSNSKHILNNQLIEQISGVGLDNVKARLDLIYKTNYTLNILDENEIYSVELKIPVK
jgi:hypothetical protein